MNQKNSKMNKKAIFSSMLLILSFLLIKNADAQTRYMHYETTEGVKVSYRWQRASFFDKSSDAVINFQFTNESAFPVEVSFDLGFYRDLQLMYEHTDNTICLLPGQSRKGSRAGLRFTAAGISLDMTREDWFAWDFTHFEVKEVSDCE